jgi:type II secretory pathway component PulC
VRSLTPVQVLCLSTLVLINGWFIGVIAFADWRLEAAADSPTGVAVTGAVVKGGRTVPPLESFNQVLAQPVFFKSRQPFVAIQAKPAAVIAPAPDPGFIVGGVIIRGGVRKAFIYTRDKSVGAWTEVGQKVMGWEVRSVDENDVTVEQQGRSLKVRLYSR